MSRAMFGASNRRPKTGRGRMSIRLRLVLWSGSGRLFRDPGLPRDCAVRLDFVHSWERQIADVTRRFRSLTL